MSLFRMTTERFRPRAFTVLSTERRSLSVKARSGAPTYGFGPHAAGRFLDGTPVEAGGDMDFVPDHTVRHGDIIEAAGYNIECVHTPGHTSNHICYALSESGALFTGDHVMGWSTTVVSPPDGDMAAYVDSGATPGRAQSPPDP